jgi:hypothetical protein
LVGRADHQFLCRRNRDRGGFVKTISGTISRVGAAQVCPAFIMQICTPLVIASAKSASGRITFGDFPPSSWWMRLMPAAAAAAMAPPPATEPVIDIMATSGCSASLRPQSTPRPLIRLNTPAGMSASAMASASSTPHSGACSLGLTTTVQPAAMAGTALHSIWLTGAFQLVMAATTPTGSRTSSILSPSASEKR